MLRTYAAVGAIVAGLAVAFGAFGAHTLEGRLDEEALAVFETGARYQMYHALGLLLTALLADKLPHPKLARWAARSLLAGIVLFSGSLYTLALTGASGFGAVAPLGGVAFLAGWGLLAVSALRKAG